MIWAVSLLTTALISRSLTPELDYTAIRSLTRVGKLYAPLPDQCSTVCIYTRG